VDQVRINLRERDEDKLAFMKAWVGNLEFFGSNLFFIIEEDVKINHPGTPSNGLLSPEA
jgi:hypothetical protein